MVKTYQIQHRLVNIVRTVTRKSSNRLKFCWLKVICSICQSNELEREIKQKTGGPSREPAKNLGAPWPTQAPLSSCHWLLRVPSEKVFDQSVCKTKEQKARLQRLASAMPKSVMLSGAKNGKVSQENKRKNLAVLAKTPRLKHFFPAKLLSSNVKTVALTSAPENVGENHDISFEALFTLRPSGHLDMLFFRSFCV